MLGLGLDLVSRGVPGIGGLPFSDYALALDFKNDRYRQTRTRTNLLTYSQDFSHANWTRNTVGTGVAPVTTADYGTAPDGTQTADRVQFSTGAGITSSDVSILRQVSASGTIILSTGSVWLKTTDGSTKTILLHLGGGAAVNTATVTGTWQRFETYLGGTGANANFDLRCLGSNNTSADILVWGAQLEAAPRASDYIPTTSAAASVTESVAITSPLRTNLLPNSANTSAWSTTGSVTKTDNFIAGPNSAMAARLVCAAAALGHRTISISVSGGVPGPSVTSSIWLKGAVGGEAVTITDGWGNATNVVLTTAWARYSYSFAPNVNGTAILLHATSGTPTFYFIDGQIEVGSEATAYIQTGAAQVSVGGAADLYGYSNTRSGARGELEDGTSNSTLGAERVTNGTFESNVSGWSNGWESAKGTVSHTGSALRIVLTATGGSTYRPRVVQALTGLTVGALYTISLNFANKTSSEAGYIWTSDPQGTGGTTSLVSGGNSASSTQVATATTMYICLFVGSAVDGLGADFDNVSVKEVILDAIDYQPANVPAIIPGLGYWSRAGLTNLLLRSQEFDNANWEKTNITVTANAVVAPDGSLTADLLTGSLAGEQRCGKNPGYATASTTITASIFAKYSNANGRYLWYRDFYAGKDTCFDLSAGVVVSPPVGVTASMVDVGNGWYRCVVTLTEPASAVVTNQQHWVLSSSSSNVSNGLLNGACYVWQAQAVVGTQPGPIIVTTSATAAVGADVLSEGPVPLVSGDDWAVFVPFTRAVAVPASEFPSMLCLFNAVTSYLNLYVDGSTGRLAADMVVGGASQSIARPLVGLLTMAVGRSVILIRRRAGKLTMGVKQPDGTVSIGTETGSATSFAGPFTATQIGHYNGGNQSNAIIERPSVRIGTFSDADITSILQAA